MNVLNDFANDFVNHATIFIIGAFSFVVALAWNDTIRLIFNEITSNNGTVLSSILYTLLITIIALIFIFFLEKYKKLIKKKVIKVDKNLDTKKPFKKWNSDQDKLE